MKSPGSGPRSRSHIMWYANCSRRVALRNWGVTFLAYHSLLACAIGQIQDTPASAPCTLCLDGTNDISRPDFTIVLSNDFPPVTCQTAAILAGTVTNVSDECQQARFVGSPLCGCPIRTQRPCLICPVVSSNSITSIDNVAIPHGNASVPALSNTLFAGAIAEPSCEVVQAALLNFELDDEVCESSVVEARAHCPCAAISEDDNATSTTSNNSTNTSIASSGEISSRCTVCRNGDAITVPGREITGFGLAPTCGVLASLASVLQRNSSDCGNIQEFEYFCGCPSVTATCPLCFDASPVPKPDALISTLRLPGDYTPTCEVLEGLVAPQPDDFLACLGARGAGVEFCGCPPRDGEHCVMCPGGLPPSTKDFIPNPDDTLTCGVLESAQFGLSSRDEKCFYIEQVAHLCGCRNGVR